MSKSKIWNDFCLKNKVFTNSVLLFEEDSESVQTFQYGKNTRTLLKRSEEMETLLGHEVKKIIEDFVTENTSNENGSDTTSSLLSKIESILDARLADLSPEDIKIIIQKMIREHLGWLVVWGGAVGGFIGFGVAII